jgi:DNA-binding NarL/FixJ family response regulator
MYSVTFIQYWLLTHNTDFLVKLLILDNYSAVYRRLIELLGGVESLSALSVARTLAEFPDKLKKLKPDIIVLDVDLPDGRSLHHIKRIREHFPAVRIYIFSNLYEYKAHAATFGADAFFDKSLEFEQLVQQLLADAKQTA